MIMALVEGIGLLREVSLPIEILSSRSDVGVVGYISKHGGRLELFA